MNDVTVNGYHFHTSGIIYGKKFDEMSYNCINIQNIAMKFCQLKSQEACYNLC